MASPLQIAAADDVELNAAERACLSSRPTVRYAPDPTFPPFEFFDDEGQYKGIAADYLAIVEQKLGIEFQLVRLPNWDAVLEQARQRKINRLPAAAKSPQRVKYLAFTQPHIRVSAAILTASSQTYLKLADLAGKTVVVLSGYVWEDLITNNYPRICLAEAPDIPTALKMASLGVADAMVTDMATTGYYIKQEGITNLRVSGAPERALEFTMASRYDWPARRFHRYSQPQGGWCFGGFNV